MIINPTVFAQSSRVSLSLPALNPGAHFSSLLINVLCGIFFFPQNRALLYAFKTYSGRYPFCSIIFLMESWNSPAVSWLAEAAFPVIFTFFLKPNLSVKISNQPVLALNSPALEPSPSFCFKFSYNNFAFSQIVLVCRYAFLRASQVAQW